MIYFDIDDTLLDYKTSQDLAAFEFAKNYSNYIDDSNHFPKLWDDITTRHMARYLSGELSFQEQRRCRIIESLGVDLPDSDIDKIFDEYYQIYEASWCLFPDVKSTLSQLSKYPLGIITNGDKTHQTYKLNKLGIEQYFSELITPACAGAPKPEMAIFRLGAERAKQSESECWYIGDNYISDYHGAKKAGYRSVWLNRNNRDEQCEHQCKNLHEFASQVLEVHDRLVT